MVVPLKAQVFPVVLVRDLEKAQTNLKNLVQNGGAVFHQIKSQALNQ